MQNCKLITVPHSGGGRVYIQPEHVVLITPLTSDRCSVRLLSVHEPLMVKLSAPELADYVDAALMGQRRVEA